MRVTLRDIEVSVRCDGRELPIHGLESTDESALAAYIPSESNKVHYPIHYCTLLSAQISADTLGIHYTYEELDRRRCLLPCIR